MIIHVSDCLVSYFIFLLFSFLVAAVIIGGIIPPEWGKEKARLFLVQILLVISIVNAVICLAKYSDDANKEIIKSMQIKK